MLDLRGHVTDVAPHILCQLLLIQKLLRARIQEPYVRKSAFDPDFSWCADPGERRRAPVGG